MGNAIQKVGWRCSVFENRVLRWISEPKRDEMTGEWRKLHIVYFLSSIFRVIKSRRMRWAGHVARMGESRSVYGVLVGKPEGKKPHGRPRRRWEDILKCTFRKWDVQAWTGSIWLRMVTGGGHLWMRQCTFRFHKMQGISCLALLHGLQSKRRKA